MSGPPQPPTFPGSSFQPFPRGSPGPPPPPPLRGSALPPQPQGLFPSQLTSTASGTVACSSDPASTSSKTREAIQRSKNSILIGWGLEGFGIGELPFRDLESLEFWAYLKLAGAQFKCKEGNTDNDSKYPKFAVDCGEYDDIQTLKGILTPQFDFVKARESSPFENALELFVEYISKAYYESLKGDDANWVKKRLIAWERRKALLGGQATYETFESALEVLAMQLEEKTFFFGAKDGSEPTIYDVKFSSYALVLRQKMEMSELFKEFARYANLVRYIDRFTAINLLPPPIKIPYEDLKNFLEEYKAQVEMGNVDIKLGKGGFGEVYRVNVPEKSQLNLRPGEYAFKVSLEKGACELLHESEMLTVLRYPNIVRMHTYARDYDNNGILVSTFSGVSLKDKIRENNLNWRATIKILRDIAYALHCLVCHDDKKRFIYTDFKLDNILVNQSMDGILIDFGHVAKEGENCYEMNITEFTRFSSEFKFEKGQSQVCARDHIYAIGVTMLKMVTNLSVSINMLKEIIVNGPSWLEDEEIIIQRLRDGDDGCRRDEATRIVSLAVKCLDAAKEYKRCLHTYEVVNELNKFLL